MIDIQPIESGDIGQCSTAMSEKLKDLLPLVEKALVKADGDHPFATFKYEDVRKAIGSGSTNPYGFVACLNRLIEEKYPDVDIKVKTIRGDVRFQRAKE